VRGVRANYNSITLTNKDDVIRIFKDVKNAARGYLVLPLNEKKPFFENWTKVRLSKFCNRTSGVG